MFDQNKINQIKELAEEFFSKMTVDTSQTEVSLEPFEKKEITEDDATGIKGVINLKINLQEPQILIGQQGQTLFEIQRLLRIIINKKLRESYYLSLDINDYKRNKIEYLEELAQSVANEVFLTKKAKELPPMNSYERRVIHAKLSSRGDVTTESHGEGEARHIVLRPR